MSEYAKDIMKYHNLQSWIQMAQLMGAAGMPANSFVGLMIDIGLKRVEDCKAIGDAHGESVWNNLVLGLKEIQESPIVTT